MKSRFFDELPEDSLKWLSPKVQGHWFGAQQVKAAWVDTPEIGNNQISQKMSRDLAWRIGENVHHTKFGDGVIVNIEGSGTQARAHINFGRNGMKLLDLGVAKLDRRG
jgi:DNA helicase-2/ATP-dependent DNA helicase PcrA